MAALIRKVAATSARGIRTRTRAAERTELGRRRIDVSHVEQRKDRSWGGGGSMWSVGIRGSLIVSIRK